MPVFVSNTDTHMDILPDPLFPYMVSASGKASKAWAVAREAEPQLDLDGVELDRMRKLKKAGIKVLPALARYNRSGKRHRGFVYYYH